MLREQEYLFGSGSAEILNNLSELDFLPMHNNG